MRGLRNSFHLLVLLLSLWTAPASAAPDFCVSTPAQLLSALHQFESAADGSTVSIGLQQGSYAVGTLLSETFAAGDRTVGLKILGGYGAGCLTRQVNPVNTVINGMGLQGSYLDINLYSDATFLLEGITFTGFNNSEVTFEFGVSGGYWDDGLFAVKYCRFLHNSSQSSIVRMYGPQLKFINNLVAQNSLSAFGGALLLDYGIGLTTMVIANNSTIANNTGGSGLRVRGNSDTELSDRISEIAHNIITNNGTPNLNLSQLSIVNPVLIYGNIYNDASYGLPLDPSNLSVNPLFVNPGADNYALATGSPAINSGLFTQRYGFPAHDLFNGPRIVGSQIDRGAIESSFNNLTTAVVTVSGDNGDNSAPLAGSLRAAIKAGNFATGPFTIKFNIPGNCPRTLAFTTPMIDITGEVIIDGNSQPGWLPNTDYGRFDATLCLLVNGQGSAPWAFHVPAGATQAKTLVRGFVFAGFNDAAIKLEGGSDHRIHGNQFGAVGFTLPNRDAIRITGNAGGAFIGGFDDPSAVNLIAGTSNTGVFLDNAAGGSVLSNNVIGFQTDGIGDGGNPIGVYVFNSPNNVLAYNYIGHSGSNGVTVSGAASTGTQLNYNFIGSAVDRSPAPNAGSGIAVIFGARNTTVGASLSSGYGANYIDSNGAAGVWISPSGGTGNRVLSNSFFNNTGIDIDLGTLGASVNQPSNPVAGPNGLQNYPVLSQAIRTLGANGTDVISGQLQSAPSSSYRLDFYYDVACATAAGGRGSAGIGLGRASVLTNAAGVANFSITLQSVGAVFGLGKVSATATAANGSTSEIGNCVAETLANLPDAIFKNSFE